MQTLRLNLSLTIQPSNGPLMVLLDNFESPEIRPNGQGSGALTGTRLLWNQHGRGGAGFEETSTEESHDGNRSLKITVESGQFYPQFIPYTASGTVNMHDFVQPPSDWQTDTFNRMRFWILLPPGVTAKSPGYSNFDIGTYLRKSNPTGSGNNQEEGGGHWYHLYNFDYTGEWHQVIMDTHPSDARGKPSGRELGDQEYVTGEFGVWNYFDALTRFYIHQSQTSQYNVGYYLDGFELYHDPNPGNVDQVFSLNGVYVPSSNTIQVGWSRRKDEATIKHEVRYSFSDIHASGWEAATEAPGIVESNHNSGRSTMGYVSDQIDVTGHDKIYIAIKPENSNLFRQIAIST